MTKFLTTFLLAGSVGSLVGCATLVSDSKYPVMIDSWPRQAEFKIVDENNIEVGYGHTPQQITLDAGDGYFDAQSYQVNYSLPGHHEKTVRIEAGLDGWYWGNLLFGGLTGMLVIDPLSGAMWKLPQGVRATLEAEPEALSDMGDGWEADEYLCKPVAAAKPNASAYHPTQRAAKRPVPKRFIVSQEYQ
ncbi:MAG: hypothetical protein Kow0065_03800 [Methylomicrobium sp.]